jgi:uncharacterized protein (TIGR03437 family)
VHRSKNYSLIAGLLLCAPSNALWAQSLPPATVAVPYFLDLGAGLNEIPPIEGITITFTFSIASGSLPPGLALQPNGVFNGIPTAAGTYNFTINFVFHGSIPGSPPIDITVPFPGGIQVLPSSGPVASISPSGLSFTFAQGATATSSQSVTISNKGAAPQTFTASASTNSGGSWLSVSSTTGTAAPFATGSVLAIVDPSKLNPGTYRGAISVAVAPSGQSATVPVIVTVSGTARQIQLSSTGLRFQTVAGVGAPPSQSISVLNGGSGSLPFSVAATTLSGAQGWLSVSPSSGTVNAASSSTVSVNVDASKLQAGDYYGQVEFSSPGVDNSPQIASVVLNVAPAGTDIGAFLAPTGLIFVRQAGGTIPASKTVQLTYPSNSPLIFNALVSFDQQAKDWFTVQPQNGNVSATSPVKLSIQPTAATLSAGVYRGDVALSYSNGKVNHIFVLLIVAPAGSIAGLEPQANANSPTASCTPTKLVPVFTQLGQNFGTVAAWPTQVEVAIVDDCGLPMVSGNVVASFSSGDPPLSLLSLQDGRRSATWQPRNPAAQVTITAKAQETSPAITGTESIGGTLQSNPSTPVISAGGAVSAASFAGNQPLAPGGFISVFGAHLSAGLNQSLGLPYQTQLGATRAIIGGRTAPLQFTVDGQVNALVPYDVPANTTQQLVIVNGPAASQPEPVVIAAAQPAIFTKNSAGTGPGIIVGAKADGTQALIDASHPVSTGDAVVIYCSGLGAVDPVVPTGTATPFSPFYNTVNTVTVTIGGKQAGVFFSGLTAGFAGLYQVNAIVPPGVPPGSDVPLVVSAAGQDSNTVTIVVK